LKKLTSKEKKSMERWKIQGDSKPQLKGVKLEGERSEAFCTNQGG